MEELYIKILKKAAEFNECAMHLNTRGAHDVLVESIPIIKEMKEQEITWDQLKVYLLKAYPEEIFRKDVFVQKLLTVFTDDAAWISTLEYYESNTAAVNQD